MTRPSVWMRFSWEIEKGGIGLEAAKRKFSFRNIRNIKKDQLLILLLVGVLLLVISLPTEGKKTGKEGAQTGLLPGSGKSETGQNDDLSRLESRLEAALAQMAGVGDVAVMITLKASAEKVVEKDRNITDEAVTESDSQGGARTTKDLSRQETTVYSGGGSSGEPYVSKELSPQVEGVVVIAEGGADSVVKQNITEAVQALFGIETHKIRIMKKSSK